MKISSYKNATPITFRIGFGILLVTGATSGLMQIRWTTSYRRLPFNGPKHVTPPTKKAHRIATHAAAAATTTTTVSDIQEYKIKILEEVVEELVKRQGQNESVAELLSQIEDNQDPQPKHGWMLREDHESELESLKNANEVELKKIQSKHEDEIRDYQANLAKSQTQLDIAAAETADLQAELMDFRSDAKKLKNRLKKKTESLSLKEDEVQLLQEDLRSTRQDMQDRLATLQDEHRIEQEQKVNMYEDLLEEGRSKRSRLRRKLEEQEAKIGALEKEAKKLEKDDANLIEQLEISKSAVTAANQRATVAEELREELERKIRLFALRDALQGLIIQGYTNMEESASDED